MRKFRQPSEVRNEAVKLALFAASERLKDGDPEGSGVIRDLAASIKKISLFKEV